VLEIDQRREREMIWRVISRYAEFAGITVALPPGTVYAILDGLSSRPCCTCWPGRRSGRGTGR